MDAAVGLLEIRQRSFVEAHHEQIVTKRAMAIRGIIRTAPVNSETFFPKFLVGCMDLEFAFAIPAAAISPVLSKLHPTMIDDHVGLQDLCVVEPMSGPYALAVRNDQQFFIGRIPYRACLNSLTQQAVTSSRRAPRERTRRRRNRTPRSWSPRPRRHAGSVRRSAARIPEPTRRRRGLCRS